jgi:hypothetical protein
MPSARRLPQRELMPLQITRAGRQPDPHRVRREGPVGQHRPPIVGKQLERSAIDDQLQLDTPVTRPNAAALRRLLGEQRPAAAAVQPKPARHCLNRDPQRLRCSPVKSEFRPARRFFH